MDQKLLQRETMASNTERYRHFRAAGVVIALLLSLTCMVGIAQDKPQTAAPAPAAPVLPGAAEMKRLSFYVGNWNYTESYPNGARNTGVYTSKLGPGGNSLVNTFSSHGPVGNFEGMLIFTWDISANKYKAFAFGDFPGALIETGEFDGDKLVFRGEIPMGNNRKMQIRNVTWLTAQGQLVSEEYSSVGGAPEKLLVRVEATKQ